MTTESLQVGQQVYVYDGYQYMPMVVIKKTPSGKVDVNWIREESRGEPKRFRADGKMEGAKLWDRDELDPMPFAEREVWIRRAKQAKDAGAALRSIEPSGFRWIYCNPDDAKAMLGAEVARLQGLLDAARALVEAI